MSDPIFIQNSRIGRAIFAIRGEDLDITTYYWGRKTGYQLPLCSIDPKYKILSRRLHALIVGPLALCLICGAAIWGVLDQDVLPEGLNHELVFKLSLLLIPSLWALIRGLPAIRFYQFSDHQGTKAFAIIRETNQAKICDAFVAELLLRVEIAENALSPGDFAGSLAQLKVSVPQVDPKAVFPEIGQDRWIASIIVGLLAAILPLLSGFVQGFDALALPIIILLCTSGLALGVFSFLANEPRRWLALIGMVLSLVPPWFY